MKMSSHTNTNVPVEEWPIRPCEIYEEEYKDCKSIKARFNQYFIYGELLDCTQWRKDFDNCKRWTEGGSTQAYNELQESERNRFKERFQAHYRNNIWEKRSTPPEDWNKPLPEWMQNNLKNTYLDHKSRELTTGALKKADEGSLCIIL